MYAAICLQGWHPHRNINMLQSSCFRAGPACNDGAPHFKDHLHPSWNTNHTKLSCLTQSNRDTPVQWQTIHVQTPDFSSVPLVPTHHRDYYFDDGNLAVLAGVSSIVSINLA
ncbi:hypothetical protein AcW1_003328 [Taiwanofungus camphoratus]|nr:hypothetical protein AcW1_003328 [Antrodia cinnamomea]KAI0944068.1 hypothetical protein AcV7_001988 [Antrodia cinnamomea]